MLESEKSARRAGLFGDACGGRRRRRRRVPGEGGRVGDDGWRERRERRRGRVGVECSKRREKEARRGPMRQAGRGRAHIHAPSEQKKKTRLESQKRSACPSHDCFGQRHLLVWTGSIRFRRQISALEAHHSSRSPLNPRPSIEYSTDPCARSRRHGDSSRFCLHAAGISSRTGRRQARHNASPRGRAANTRGQMGSQGGHAVGARSTTHHSALQESAKGAAAPLPVNKRTKHADDVCQRQSSLPDTAHVMINIRH